MEPSLESQAWHREPGGHQTASVITSHFYLRAFNTSLSTTKYSIINLNLGGSMKSAYSRKPPFIKTLFQASSHIAIKGVGVGFEIAHDADGCQRFFDCYLSIQGYQRCFHETGNAILDKRFLFRPPRWKISSGNK